MKYLFLIVFFSNIQAIIIAQEIDTVNKKKTEYIVTHDSFLFTRLSFNNHIEDFAVNTKYDDYLIKPNTLYKLKLNVSYKIISFAIAVSPKFIPGNNDDSKKGKSKIYSFGLTLYLKNWIQNAAFNMTKGFYLDNTSDFIPNWNKSTDDYIQFPELKYLGFSGSTAYKFNPKFSLKAFINQTEHQLRSAGSFVPVLLYRYYIMDNQIELTGTNSSQKTNNFEANLQLGYFYTLVISRKLYLSVGAAVGGGFIYTKLLTRYMDGIVYSRSTNPILRMEGMLAVRYQSERFFAGAQLLGSWEKFPQTGTSATTVNNVVSFQIFVGYRFNAPKFVKSSVENIPIPVK